MTETEAQKLDLAVECFKSGLSLSDSATRYDLTLTSLEAEVERRAKAKRSESSTSKSDFVYESAQMEDAVNSVLCGMSIKDAATAYGVSKNALKQALRQELDKEPVEEGALVVAEEPEPEEADAIFSATEPLPDAVQFTAAASPNLFVIEPTPRRPVADVKSVIKTTEDLGDEIPVHCGEFEGTLHRTRFMCPGLRSECIVLGDGRWVTPKTFSIIGGKASLKNWKNAVRINNVSLRHYMDSGLLDFYEHELACSGKCSHKSGGSLGKYQSRINSMKIKTAIDLQTQEELTTTGANTPLQKVQHIEPADPPALLPFMENVKASPAFTVLRQAQGKDINSSAPASQPVFPMPTLLPEGKLQISSGGDSHVSFQNLTQSMAQKLGSKSVSLIPASISTLSKNMHQSQVMSLAGQAGAHPQTIIVRPIHDAGAKSTVLQGRARGQVTYLVPTSTSGSRVQLSANSVLVPLSSQQQQQQQAPAVTTTTASTSSFPNIENIMKDSSHFWKGILDVGLLDLTIHDMKVQLSTVKRRAMLHSSIGPSDAKALSKVASALWMQESIRHKLAEKKDDMMRQNDRIQSEIDELKRKMVVHERRQQELKRKTDVFDDFIAKRPCIIDSSDDEDEWTTSNKSFTVNQRSNAEKSSAPSHSIDKNEPTARSTSPTPISIFPIGTLLDSDKTIATVHSVAPEISHNTFVTPAKSSRSSRKGFVPVKKPATPTQFDDMYIKDELMDTDDTDDITQNGGVLTNGLLVSDVHSESDTGGIHETELPKTNGTNGSVVDENSICDDENTENDDVDEDVSNDDSPDVTSTENGDAKPKEAPMKMVIRIPGAAKSRLAVRETVMADSSEVSDGEL